jgi:hypothetical protein
MGPVSGRSVLDLDPRNDHHGETAAWLVPLMPPPTVISPNGWHWYIAECCPTLINVKPGLDIKGEGGYVLAPPSIGPSGRPYERLCSGFTQIPAAVRAVIEEARVAREECSLREKPEHKRQANPARPTPDVILEGQRRMELWRLGRRCKLKGWSPESITKKLAKVNTEQCRPPLDVWEVAQVTRQVIETPDRARYRRA